MPSGEARRSSISVLAALRSWLVFGRAHLGATRGTGEVVVLLPLKLSSK